MPEMARVEEIMHDFISKNLEVYKEEAPLHLARCGANDMRFARWVGPHVPLISNGKRTCRLAAPKLKAAPAQPL